MNLQIEVTDSDRSEAAAFFKKQGNAASLRRRVADTFEAARRSAHDPTGQSRGVPFVEHVLYPARRVFEVQSRRLSSESERAALCLAAIRFFENCAAMDLTAMQPAGNAAAAQQPSVAAPAPPTFNPRAMIARIASMGVSLSVNTEGEIVASPADSLHPQIKDQIRNHRAEILHALQENEVIA